MWPEDAEHFLGSSENLELAHPGFTKRRMRVDEGHFGRFHSSSAPLSVMYVPDRRDASSEGVVIEPLRSASAMHELLPASFVSALAGASGRSGVRLRLLGDVLASVPVKRLSYPDRRDCLADVVAAIELDRAGGA